MPDSESAYRIRVEPIAGRVIARRGSTVLADSRSARMMHETRLPPTIYFPKQDVPALTGSRSDHRSFCPFKGTATYWAIEAGGETVANAAWSYENALPESVSKPFSLACSINSVMFIVPRFFTFGARAGSLSGILIT